MVADHVPRCSRLYCDPNTFSSEINTNVLPELSIPVESETATVPAEERSVPAVKRLLTATKALQQPQQGQAPLDNVDGTRQRAVMTSWYMSQPGGGLSLIQGLRKPERGHTPIAVADRTRRRTEKIMGRIFFRSTNWSALLTAIQGLQQLQQGYAPLNCTG